MDESSARSLRAARVVLCLAMLAAAVAIIALQRGTVFASDELRWLEWSGTYPDSQVLHPYNGHLILIPLVLYRAVLELFGTGHGAFAVLEVLCLLPCSALFFELAQRRVGPWLALAPSVVLLFVASPWLLQPMLSMGPMLTVAFGLAALLSIERKDRLGDALCCVFLALALATFSVAIAFVAGVAVIVLRRPDRWRAIWIVVVPIAAYLFWRHVAGGYVEGTRSGIAAGNARYLPIYFSDSLTAVGASLFGFYASIDQSPGISLFVTGGYDEGNAILFATLGSLQLAATAGLAYFAYRRRPVPTGLWAALAILVVMWVAQGMAVGLGRLPTEQRFVFAGMVAVLLVAVELARLLPRRRAVPAVGLLLAVVVIGCNVPRFVTARKFVTDYSRVAKPDLTAMDLEAHHSKPAGFLPARDAEGIAPADLISLVSGYKGLVDLYGAGAETPVDELGSQPADVRFQVDQLMARMLRLDIEPTGPLPVRGCPVFHGGAKGAAVALPAGGARLKADQGIKVALFRYADMPATLAGQLAAGAPGLLRIPTDRSSVPWKLGLPAGIALRVCPIARP